MATWHTDMLCSCLDTYVARKCSSKQGRCLHLSSSVPLQEGSWAHMMKHLFMLLSLALMIGAAMALSGVAQAKSNSASPDAKCAKQASAKLGKGFDPSGYTFFGGTAGDDNFDGKATTGADVFCGFDGANSIYTLDAGDIFLGGDGNDSVGTNNGTFNGGLGDDSVGTNNGTFNGQADNDSVSFQNYGTFNGGLGVDSVI